MTKDDRREFYLRIIKVSAWYLDFFKNIIHALRKKRLINKPNINLSHECPKIPK